MHGYIWGGLVEFVGTMKGTKITPNPKLLKLYLIVQ